MRRSAACSYVLACRNAQICVDVVMYVCMHAFLSCAFDVILSCDVHAFVLLDLFFLICICIGMRACDKELFGDERIGTWFLA